MGGMTSLFPLLLHYIHIATHFLLYFVFQSDPHTGRSSDGVFTDLTYRKHFCFVCSFFSPRARLG